MTTLTTHNLNLPEEETRWKTLANSVLKIAKAKAVTQAAVSIHNNLGFSVKVRMGEVETVEHHRDKSITVTVFAGKQKGSASTVDTHPDAIKNTVDAACRIADATQNDPCAGLPDPECMATDYTDLDLYHPWSIRVEQAIDLAKNCEDHARAIDSRLTNSEGVELTTHQGISVYANSHGFMGHYLTSMHSMSCTLVAQDKQTMQRDGYFTVARDASDLLPIDQLAQEAAHRTVQRLGARRISTIKTPVIFHAEVARSLFSSFLAAISGSQLYRKASFLTDHLGQSVFPEHMHIFERAHLPKGLGSAPFDGEGVMTQNRDLVAHGLLQGYLLSSYSARKLGMKTTGNAGGSHNTIIKTGNDLLPDLLKKMDTGLLITELLGQGVNLVTGDYSRGAAGFWVEKGTIQYPVEEITLAGNLRDMFKRIVTVGKDINRHSSILTGSVLLEEMMVAGQ